MVNGLLEPTSWSCDGAQVKNGSRVVIWTSCKRTHNQYETSCGFRPHPRECLYASGSITNTNMFLNAQKCNYASSNGYMTPYGSIVYTNPNNCSPSRNVLDLVIYMSDNCTVFIFQVYLKSMLICQGGFWEHCILEIASHC